MEELRLWGVSAGPNIEIQGSELIVSTPISYSLFTLFVYSRSIRFNRDKRIIFYSQRIFWFFSSLKVIRFDDVDHLEYKFNDIGTDWGLIPSRQIFGRHDTVEWFSIILILKDKTSLAIGKFLGEGSVSYGLAGWILGDDIVDVAGHQEQDSRTFVQYICELLGVSIGEEGYTGALAPCESCGRAVSKYSQFCLYCGTKKIT